MRIGTQEIQYLNAFQNISNATAKDCLVQENQVVFLVKEGQMGLAIGKNGATIKKLELALKKKIELFEHKKDAATFVQNAFPKTKSYLDSLNITGADPIDIIAKDLIYDEVKYERASQALRRRFVRGASIVEAIDRGERHTRIKREGVKSKYRYFVEGMDGSWNEPDERIWVVAMYALWQKHK